MAIRWLSDISADDGDEVGGKAASLGELRDADLPVPNAFVVTTEAYRRAVEAAGIDDIFADLDTVDPGDAAALNELESRVGEALRSTPVPEAVRKETLAAYDELAADFKEPPLVAVRSSATAEDLPDASFAGQQETFLNVGRDALVENVVDCWASLFTGRAISYRVEQGFDHGGVTMAVVVQAMVDADRSGVMFTADPNTGGPRTTIEAAWGLGEGVVSGEVSPDTYVLEDGTVTDVTVAEKRSEYLLDRESGETVSQAIEDDRRSARVLSDEELGRLSDLGDRIEAHYGKPQDVEWAMLDGEVYLLQSRPITTIGRSEATSESGDSESAGEVLVSGLAASPGTAVGPARIIRQLDQLDKVEAGDVIVTPMTTPDMVPAMKRAAAIVTDEGGLTSHASIVSRELGVPAITGTGDATQVLADGQVITVNGDRGTIEAGGALDSTEPSPEPTAASGGPEPTGEAPGLTTATEVKVNVSIPAAAERAAATGADGVGLLRLEHMVLELGATPGQIIEKSGPAGYVEQLVDGIRTVADAFYPRPVRVRTLDAPTDEFRELEGGEDEPREHNPMLGYRGIRRSFAEPDVFEHELAAFAELYDLGYDNVEIMFPLVNDAADVERAVELLGRAGIDPDRRPWGVMIETPAAALVVDELVDTGLEFVSFGTNDLTQYTLAVDRNNERVADRYDAFHPAVRRLIGPVIETCREHGVRTSICGEAGSQPEMVEFLVERGISSISANIDAVGAVQQRIQRTEQRILLDSVR